MSIKPAMSAAEWAAAEWARDGDVAVGEIRDDDGALCLVVEGSHDYTPAWLNKADRHAVAALALHGQDFGFTWEMVNALEAMWLKLDNEGWGDLARAEDPSPHRLAADAIDRLAALLPPRTEG